MPFDPDSGLVYNEQVVRAKRPPCKRHLPTFSRGRPPACSSSAGVATLRDVAIRSVLSNLNGLDSTSLGSLPETLLRELWDLIKRSELASLQIWKLFINTPNRTADSEYQWRASCACKAMPYYLDVLEGPQSCWMTSLTLSGDQWSPSDLVAVSRLDNLRLLSVTSTRPAGTLTDRIIRAWADAARDSGSFQHLDSLVAHNQTDLTAHCLQSLRLLPAIEAVCLLDCAIKPGGSHHDGWRVVDWHVSPTHQGTKGTATAPRGESQRRRPITSATPPLASVSDVARRVLRRTIRVTDAAPHTRALPVLDALLGIAPDPPFTPAMARCMLCLERDHSSLDKPVSPASTTPAALHGRPAAKRRRVNRRHRETDLRDLLADTG